MLIPKAICKHNRMVVMGYRHAIYGWLPSSSVLITPPALRTSEEICHTQAGGGGCPHPTTYSTVVKNQISCSCAEEGATVPKVAVSHQGLLRIWGSLNPI